MPADADALPLVHAPPRRASDELPREASEPAVLHRRSWRERVARVRQLGGFAILVTFASTLVTIAAIPWVLGGETYYRMPKELRPSSPLYDLLRPGGGLGLTFGVLGTVLMLAMLSYTIRKAIRGFGFLGSPSWWLRFHIICGIMGPIFILHHAGFAAPNGLVAVGFWCMILVALSGSFGRYVFAQFPRAVSGLQVSYASAREALAELRARVVEQTRGARHPDKVAAAVALARDLDAEAHGLFGLLRVDAALRWRAIKIRALLWQSGLGWSAQRSVARELKAQLRLKRNLEVAQVARRLFRYWHIFHAPLAQGMYIVVLAHVLQAVLLGGSLVALGEFLFTPSSASSVLWGER
jgi:hypothetical protein